MHAPPPGPPPPPHTTRAERRGREAAAPYRTKAEQTEAQKRLGRTGRCIITQMLPYFDWCDSFIVPVVHALLHNVAGGFLCFALRPITDTTNRDTVISNAARKVLRDRRRHIIPTCDIGRGYKCVVKHPGLYTFEDYKNFALVYCLYMFHGDILPPLLAEMWANLCTAIGHYLTFGEFTDAARRRARAALLSYAKQVETLPECQHLLTPSLHVLLCR